MVIHPDSVADHHWAMNQALRSSATAAVLAWPQTIDDRTFRRWQLAAEEGGCCGLLVRPEAARAQPSWADVRLLVEPLPLSPSANRRRLRITVLRCRGGVADCGVDVELDDETYLVHSVARLAAWAARRRLAGALTTARRWSCWPSAAGALALWSAWNCCRTTVCCWTLAAWRTCLAASGPLAEAIVRDFAKLRLKVCVSVADTIGAAWAMSRGEGSRKGDRHLLCEAPGGPFRQKVPVPFSASPLILPPDTPPEFFYPLPVELLRLPRASLRWLGELGILSVGQLEMLPREEFLSRFGPVLLTRMDQLMGRLDEPAPAVAAESRFAARWSAEYPTLRRATIEGVLAHFSRRVAAALDRCGWVHCGWNAVSISREGRGERGERRVMSGEWRVSPLSPLPSPLPPLSLATF